MFQKTSINSLSKITDRLDSVQSIDLPIQTNRKCGTSFENTGMFDQTIARSVCAAAQFNQCLGAPAAQWVKTLAYCWIGPGFEPRSRWRPFQS